jgi:thioredoxin reductase (NADPH)
LPGFRGGVSGPELLARIWKQNEEVGTERLEGLFSVHPQGDGSFQLESTAHRLTAERVILATGMADIQPPIDNLIRLRRRGLLRYCPVCDAFEYKGKALVVLAQDEHGLLSALFLARFAKRIAILWPSTRPVPKECQLQLEKAASDMRRDEGEIRLIRGELLAIEERFPEGGIWAIVSHEGEEQKIAADVGYVELGATVNDFAFRHLHGLSRDDAGHLITTGHQQLTVPGLYATGDCTKGLAQISVAAAHAAIAATHINNHLGSGL